MVLYLRICPVMCVPDLVVFEVVFDLDGVVGGGVGVRWVEV